MTRWFTREPAKVSVRAASICLGFALLTTLLTPLAIAESPSIESLRSANDTQSTETTVEPTTAPRGFSSEAMMAEIEALFLSHQEYERAATVRLAELSPAEQQRIAQETAAATEELMTEVLRVQARHAREAGRETFALRIEAQIELREMALADPNSRVDLGTRKTRQPSRVLPETAAKSPAVSNTKGLGQEGGQR
jgi:hypothetical protein